MAADITAVCAMLIMNRTPSSVGVDVNIDMVIVVFILIVLGVN